MLVIVGRSNSSTLLMYFDMADAAAPIRVSRCVEREFLGGVFATGRDIINDSWMAEFERPAKLGFLVAVFAREPLWATRRVRDRCDTGVRAIFGVPGRSKYVEIGRATDRSLVMRYGAPSLKDGARDDTATDTIPGANHYPSQC